MLPYLLPITSLMLGTALLLLGNGLLSTLIVLRGSLEGFSDQTLGMMGSAYFAGFFIGTYLVPRLVARMGHIRASNFFSAAIAASVLMHAIVLDPWVWMGLRVLTGVALVGFYTVIESWLNSSSAPERRGQVFAFYMVVNMASIAAAQQFLRIGTPADFMLFSAAAIMICLSVMPIAATRLPQPTVTRAPRLTLGRIWLAAPVAFVGAVCSGLTMGTFWSMGPLYAARLGLDEIGIATLVSTMIVGGAVLQWPLGRLSDRRDRRTVLGMAAAGAAAAGVALALFGAMEMVLFVAAFLYGGMAFAVYPIVVAHLVDHLTQDEILAGNAAVLLLYGIGAVIGPALAGLLMGWGGAAAMPAFFAVTLTPLALYALLQARRIPDEVVESAAHFVPMVRTSETALEIAATAPNELAPAQMSAEPGQSAGAEPSGPVSAAAPPDADPLGGDGPSSTTAPDTTGTPEDTSASAPSSGDAHVADATEPPAASTTDIPLTAQDAEAAPSGQDALQAEASTVEAKSPPERPAHGGG